MARELRKGKAPWVVAKGVKAEKMTTRAFCGGFLEASCSN